MASAAVAGVALPLAASALEKDWKSTVGSGGWSTSTNWTPSAPAAGDDAVISHNDATNRVVTYDYTGASITLNSVRVDNLGTGTNLLSQSANSLTALSEYIGYNGTGTYLQTGGVNSVTGTGTNGLFIGYNATSSGTYTLNAGGLLSSSATVTVGNNGRGTFTLNGGSMQLGQQSGSAPNLIIAANAGSTGTFVLSGNASLNLPNSGSTLYLAYFGGNATFTQNGGSVFATHFQMSDYDGTSQYNLQAGTLNGGYEDVGVNGVAFFNQTGGTNSGGEIDIAAVNGSQGSYSISGASSVLQAQSLYVGGASIGTVVTAGQGTFTQNGGAVRVSDGSGSLHLAAEPGGVGTYTLNAGTLSVGHGGTATTSGIFLAEASNTTATMNLMGGKTTTSYLSVGSGGTARLTVSNGASLTVEQYLVITAPAGATNRLDFYSGNISAGGIFAAPGGGVFNWITGTVNITGVPSIPGTNPVFDSASTSTFSQLNPFGNDLTLGPTQALLVTSGEDELIGGQGGTGRITLNGGTHLVSGNLRVGAGGTLTVLSGSLSYGTLWQTGGTINTNLTNPTTFNVTGGTFNGSLVNNGTANVGGPFAPSGFIQNFGVMNVTGGASVTPGAGGLSNFGTFNLNGGTIGGSAVVLSDYGSIFNATNATIAAPLLNNGAMNVSGNVTAGVVTNVGSLTLAGPGTALRPTSLVNNGAISLNGGAIAGSGAFVNAGAVSGSGAIAVAFTNAGTLLLPAGSLTVGGPSFVNNGNVQLASVGAVISGGLLTNNGTLGGIGTVANAVNNAGTIDPGAAGTLTFGGAVTNAASGLIRVASGSKVLVGGGAGLVNNLGTINLIGGTFDNNNQPRTNTGVITGYGTLATGGLTNAPGARSRLPAGSPS